MSYERSLPDAIIISTIVIRCELWDDLFRAYEVAQRAHYSGPAPSITEWSWRVPARDVPRLARLAAIHEQPPLWLTAGYTTDLLGLSVIIDSEATEMTLQASMGSQVAQIEPRR